LTEEGSENFFTSTIRKWLLPNLKRGVDMHIGRGYEECERLLPLNFGKK
jgi:hypothetical protein